MTLPVDRLDRLIQMLPQTFPGPGGAVAVLKEGQILARHAWGYANLEQRIPFTPSTLFRMCSITKHFTCAVLLDGFPDPTALDADVRDRLPTLMQAAPTTLNLCHNQSGLRDYWAVAMLLGAPAEGAFGDREADQLISGSRSLQFNPGTRYAYANQNFRLLSNIVQDRTGQSLAERLRSRIFDPAQMDGAFLAADTRAMPDGTEGYEGDPVSGFRPAINRILWTGDAGLGASLDAMIAWERHIDATRDDPDSLYRRLCAPVTFSDGAKAAYGFGLARSAEFGRTFTGHGGALRGWRSHRLYAPADRISVVVMFNHLSDAHQAAIELFGAALGEEISAVVREPAPPPAWLGAYLEPETGLSVRIENPSSGVVRLRYGHAAERLTLQPDGTAKSAAVQLRTAADGLWMDRVGENQSSRLSPLTGGLRDDAAGLYRCEELGAALTIADAGGSHYGAFSGALGPGRMEQLTAIGPDVWALPCPRALDHTPPGDFTLAIKRGPDGGAQAVEVGCWLARGLLYTRCA